MQEGMTEYENNSRLDMIVKSLGIFGFIIGWVRVYLFINLLH